MGDVVWMKVLHNKCTSKFGKGAVMGNYSLHLVLVNGMLCHIRDIHPIKRIASVASDYDSRSLEHRSLECEDSNSSELKIIRECKYFTQTLSNKMNNEISPHWFISTKGPPALESQAPSDPQWRSMRQKRILLHPGCHLWDLKIGGGECRNKKHNILRM